MAALSGPDAEKKDLPQGRLQETKGLVSTHAQRTRAAAMTGAVCAALAILAPARPARGQEPGARPSPAPITLVDPGTAPFSSGELSQALLARLTGAADVTPPQVRVAGAGGVVTVEVGDRSRRVELGDRTGPAAARVVALVVAELMSDAAADLAEAAEAGRTESASPGVRVPQASDETPPASLSAAPSPEPSAPLRPLLLSVTGGVARGIGSEELLAGTVDADLVVALGDGGFRLTPSAGLIYMPTRNDGTWSEVSFTSAIARVLAGRNFGFLDLAGGPFVARYSIGGANPHAGALFGAEALARIAAPLSRRARLVAETRVHAYGNRVRVAWADGNGYATPRLELTFGVGLAWDWSS